MTPPPFLIPSLVWYGLAPLLGRPTLRPLVPALKTGWGGMLTSDEDVAQALLALDPALVLLNLAGYQALEVAIGVPNGPAATSPGDLLSVDMATMEIDRGTAHPSILLEGQAHVSLWIEPRFPVAPAPPPSPTLDLTGIADAMQLELIELFFAANGTGWLQITWPAGQIDPWWPDQVKLQLSTLVQGLIEALDSHNTSASENGADPVVCGLLGAYDSRTWTMPIPIEPEASPLLPGVADFGLRLREIVDGNLAEFLNAEISPPEPTALDRWTEGLDDAGQNAAIEALGTSADELGDLGLDAGNDDERTREFARSAYAAFTALPVTTLLFLWQALGVVDFLAFASSVKSGIVIDDGAGGRGPLAKGWVYVREVGSAKVTVYFTDAAGQLLHTDGAVRDTPWDYTHPFTPKAGAELAMAYSRGARPLPARLLVGPEFDQWLTAITVPADELAPLTLSDARIAVTQPKELELWPLLWLVSDKPEDPYLTDGLVQNIAKNQEQPAPAIAANSAAAPRLRGLVVQGSVDAAATSVEIELAASDGTAIMLRQSLQANAPQIPRAAATLGAPAGATRSFDATIVLDPATVPQRLGGVQIVVVRHGLDGTRFEALSQLLTGVQIALVDDPAPTQRGPFLSAADEVVVVDFKGASPQASAALLAGKARVRRMVEYKIDITEGLYDPALPAQADTNPRIPKPRMPRWMAEAQLAGADRIALKDLMRRRAFRDSRPAASEPAPLQKLSLDLVWKLDLAWDGPDANAGSFGAAQISRPNQHHSYKESITGSQSVVLRFDPNGNLVDAKGAPIAVGLGGELPAALADEKRPPFIEADRRRPQVLVEKAQRQWGRSGGGAASCLVIEWQPILAKGDQELIRGGNGILTLNALSLNGAGINLGRVLGKAAAAVDAGAPVARLPDFRVIGANPSAAQVDLLVAALVKANYKRLQSAGASPGTMLLSLACWQAVMALIFKHESGVRGGASQFDARDSGSVRYKTLYFGTESRMPIFGPPHGYGIGQLDYPLSRGPDPDEVWSFVANMNTGVRVLIEEKAAAAYGQLSGNMPNPPDQRFRAVFQRQVVRAYNGGTEFQWGAKAGAWAIKPSLQWADSADHTKGPNANLPYPNQVFAAGAGSGVVYFTSPTGVPNTVDPNNLAGTIFPWPITFAAGDFGPLTDQVPP